MGVKDFTAEFGSAEFAVLADEALVAEAHQLLRICGASVASLKDGASPDELAVAYTYQFARLRPAVMKLLLLPTGTGAIITGDEVTEVIGPDQKVRIQGPSA